MPKGKKTKPRNRSTSASIWKLPESQA